MSRPPPGAVLVGPLGRKLINVISFNTQLAADVESVQLQAALAHYVVKVRQNGFTFVVQCSSEQEKEDLQTFIRQHHTENTKGNLNTLRIIYPAYTLDYTGFITSIDGGGQRFDYAPQVQLSMSITDGLLDSVSKVYSGAPKSKTATQDATNPDPVERYIFNQRVIHG